jgi:hypothetical protein
MGSLSENAEARAIEADLAAQEFGDPPPAAVRSAVLAPCYVRGHSPEGHDVVFTPGERLPEWAADALANVNRSDGAQVVDLADLADVVDAPRAARARRGRRNVGTS